MILQRLFLVFKLFALCLALLPAMSALSGSACAADLITRRAYFEDASASRSFKDIQQQDFTPYQGVLSRGYTPSATWIQLEITPPPSAKPDEQLVLMIKPVFLDEIALFDPLSNALSDPLTATNKPKVTGDTTPFDQQDLKSLFHAFVVPAGHAPRFVWLRVQTTSTTLLDVESFTPAEMSHYEFETLIFAFCVLAAMGVFLLQGIIHWVNHREVLLALFVARQFFLFLYAAALFGFHRYWFHPYLSPHQLDAIYSWIVLCATALTFIFERQFQKEYMLNKFGQYVVNGFVVWSFIVCATMIFGDALSALKLNMMLNAAGLILLLINALFCIDSQKIAQSSNPSLLDKRLLVSYYVIVNVVVLSSSLSFLGMGQGSNYTFNVLIYYTLIAGVLMTFLMQLRTQKMVKAHNDYEKNLLLSQQETELEKKRRQEQAHLLHMLMHELKNPLAIIEMAQRANNDKATTNSYISRSVKNMKDVIDRCIKTDRLSEGNVQTHLENVDVDDFVKECLAARDPDEHDIEVLFGQHLDVKTDKQLFGVMLNNLLDNAIRYGDPVAPVELRAHQVVNAHNLRGVSVTISNRPSAASWPDGDKVFTKYYRSEGAKAKSGTGLGLYLVRTLARLVGGECRYLPDDKFIRFELWLPS